MARSVDRHRADRGFAPGVRALVRLLLLRRADPRAAGIGVLAMTDHTHDPALRSWVEAANAPGAGFPIQNLPYVTFREEGGAARLGVGIGDRILDLTEILGI